MKNHKSQYDFLLLKHDFSDYPFDSHDCPLDFGMPSQVFNLSAIFAPVEILQKDSTTAILDFEQEIPNEHLPFTFSITSHSGGYGHYNFRYKSPFTGIVLKVKRDGISRLVGTFYAPTGIFGCLSMLSYFIHPDVVRYH